MPDGFPIQSNDVDFQVQRLISQDLENAQAVWAAFDEMHPGNPEPTSLGSIIRRQKAPSSADLYPRAAKGRLPEWLAPMLRRLRYQNAQSKTVKSFQIDLTWMVNAQIREIRAVTEEHFVALAEQADCFEGASAAQYLLRMLHFTKSFEKSAPLSGRAAKALGTVLEFARQLYKAASFWENFVWPYFRSTALVASGDGYWDAGVRRDIESMKPQRRELWLRVFDGKDRHTGGACEPSGPALAVLKALPKEQLEADLRRCSGALDRRLR